MIRIDMTAELRRYNIESKFNDYIGMQKAVINTLKEEGFFDDNVVINKETQMTILITAKGIKETLGSGKRFQSLPRTLKELKIATIHALPEIIKEGQLIEDEVENAHGDNARFAYFKTKIQVDDIDMFVKVSVRKNLQTNKFWIHNVIIQKVLNTQS